MAKKGVKAMKATKATKAMKVMKASKQSRDRAKRRAKATLKAQSQRAADDSNAGCSTPDFDILFPPYSSYLREMFNSRHQMRPWMHPDKMRLTNK